MDRLDTLQVFVAVAEAGSFVAAARRLRRSTTAVSRAVAMLEDRLGARLFNRTTRAVALTEAGARHLEGCRRALAEFAALESSVASERLAPQGLLTVTAPEMFGRLHILPLVQDFMRENEAVEVSLLLLDRVVSLVDEGIDVAIRIAHLPDSSLRAIPVGSMRRVVSASPRYLAVHGEPRTPRDLAGHEVIAIAAARPVAERWSFPGRDGTMTVGVASRLVVNTVQAGLDAAVAGGGIVRVFSYQAAPLEEQGLLRRVLAEFEPPPVPIHIVHLAGRHLSPKIRLFIDHAVPRLRRQFSG